MPKPIKYKFHMSFYSRKGAEEEAQKFRRKGLKTRIVRVRLRYGTYQYNLWVERR